MNVQKKYKIGNGYDIHRLTENRKLILGGVEILFEKGLLGHSDADVLLHAIMDAMLGALSLGDIGCHFPPSDPKFKDISSLKLLKKVHDFIKNENFTIVNIDSIIQAEKPKLKDHIPSMKEAISQVLEIDKGQISIKSTTMEGLGPIGKGDAIAASAVILLESIN